MENNQNFILLHTKQANYQSWEIKLFAFKMLKYFENLLNTPQIEYRISPIYANFKKSWAVRIGKWFRLICVIIPIITLIRLIIDFSMTFWWWFWCIVSAPFIIINIYNFLADVINKLRVQAHNETITTTKAVITRYGQPGGGKTSSLFYDFKILSDLMWAKIQREYKLLEPYLDVIDFFDRQVKEDALEIIEAYKYYKKSKTYPCLWSSVPAFVDGVPVNRLTADHLMQRKRLPYGSVVVLDEVSLILPQELFRDKPYELRELCKFPRHFGDFHFGSTEQGKNNMLIDLRNSSAENKCMVEQKWILKPQFMINVYNFIVDHTKHMTRKKATLLRVWDKIIHAIGFRKYTYYDAGTEDRTNMTKQKSFILPPYLNISYDDRAFKNAYRCKDEKLENSSWEHMRLSKKEIDQIFTKELQQRLALRKKEKEKQKEEERKKRKEEKQKEKEAKRKNTNANNKENEEK